MPAHPIPAGPHPPEVGAPPPLRGHSPWHLARFAIACRASAIVLALQGHPAPAARLRRLAVAADAQTGDGSTVAARPGRAA